MTYLVTGGAGYIGSFMVKRLLDEGHEVIVADSLERGHRDLVDSRAKLVEGNLLNKEFLKGLFSEHHFDGVMHFAAFIAVGESMKHPGLYIQNNVLGTVNLLDVMTEYQVKSFIFSSTGTVYGTPKEQPIPESHETNPENPYSESKRMVERILHWYYEISGISYAVLRYFNASGAAIDGTLGEGHDPETHLIPNAIMAALKRSEFPLYGSDYPTRDGTAIRDYIHVLDLVEAHILTLKKIHENPGEYTYNVGTGKGWTNKEVIEMIKRVSGVEISVVMKERREGDVAETVADPTKIKNELGFEPRYSDLETIISSAWKWHSKSS